MTRNESSRDSLIFIVEILKNLYNSEYIKEGREMKENKSLRIVTISTILFGIISKWLVGIPYMAWGHFDLYFILSFVIWVLYLTSLYIIGKIESNGNDSSIKISCYGFIFGMIASCIKMGMDSFIMGIVEKTDNQILLTFAMEIGILLFGSMIMIFLSCILQKRKFVWNKSLSKYVGILSGTIGIYAIAFFYFYSKYQALLSYTDIHSLTKSGSINLNTMLGMESLMQYSRTFTMLSMIVCVLFFIVFWIIVQKRGGWQDENV